MSTKFFKIILVQIFLCFTFFSGFSQININVSKDSCLRRKGHFINVEVRMNGRLLDSTTRNFYNYREVCRLPDSIKIRIIEKVFEFVSDTSMCCQKVNMYQNIDHMGCFNYWPSSKDFSIRVEALFIINRIAYYPITFRVGCYPVLFDTETKREINDDNSLINIMIEHYREWLKEYKRTDKLPYYRFLREGRIRWWGMHLS